MITKLTLFQGAIRINCGYAQISKVHGHILTQLGEFLFLDRNFYLWHIFKKIIVSCPSKKKKKGKKHRVG